MRVISGKFRGKKLSSPTDATIRPTLDRVKETLFNILAPRLNGCRFLDLFAGSGSIGIEALSRNASEVVFVEKNAECRKLLEKNLRSVSLSAEVFKTDFRDALSLLKGKKFDVIYVDPPYRAGYYEAALNGIAKFELLEQGGVVVCEHTADEEIADSNAFEVYDCRKIGIVRLSFLRWK